MTQPRSNAADHAVRIVRDIGDLDPLHRCVLVPTMGDLHAGHAALVEQAAGVARARCEATSVVVSVFVNPTQFGETIDYERYPRVLDRDAATCERAGADFVFAPHVTMMYPPGEEPPVPKLPRVATEPGLEDKYRVGHFPGVCQVIHRFFTLLNPVAAIFGEKDWQQLRVIDAMSREHDLGVEIIPGPTFREPDGLAMSSRNQHLVGDDRQRARSISLALRAASERATVAEAEAEMRGIIESSGARLEYAVVRDAQTLAPLDPERRRDDPAPPARALAAARFGEVRLIDNMPWA